MNNIINKDYNLIVILGATATGKTKLAVQLANELSGEIISADSRQVFRGMNIGTGKDLHEYGTIPYHLIDCCEAGEEYSLFNFLRGFNDSYTNIEKRGKTPILCGGTGLYLDAVLRRYNMIAAPINQKLRQELEKLNDIELAEMLQKIKPAQHNTTDLLDRHRTLRAIEIAEAETENEILSPPDGIKPVVLGIRWERVELKERITNRLQERLNNGMVEEVQELHQQGVSWDALHYYGLEYRWIGVYLQGLISYDEMVEGLNKAIHTFSKQQEKWFRRLERNGIAINWFQGGEDIFENAMELFNK